MTDPNPTERAIEALIESTLFDLGYAVVGDDAGLDQEQASSVLRKFATGLAITPASQISVSREDLEIIASRWCWELSFGRDGPDDVNPVRDRAIQDRLRVALAIPEPADEAITKREPNVTWQLDAANNKATKFIDGVPQDDI